MAQVVTTDLVVRSAPGVNAESEIYADRLNEPMLLFVLDGPVAADGYDWYLVEPFTMRVCMDVCSGPPPFGWVAQAGKDGDPWIAQGSVECPTASVEATAWLTAPARVACFGTEVIMLEGTVGGCFVGETIAFLQNGCELRPRDYVPLDTFERFLVMRQAEGVQFAQDGAVIRVTGHFDDPVAETCARLASPFPELGLVPMAPERAVLLCRGEFVVTRVERV